jgi:hypothetical protein
MLRIVMYCTHPIGRSFRSKHTEDRGIISFGTLLHFSERIAPSGYGPNGSNKSSRSISRQEGMKSGVSGGHVTPDTDMDTSHIKSF